ncbi:hypothetical protein DFP85_11971 [Halomonas ventosae]|uniref:Uncharacterized protein n=1 Tax=Halomonas ventosae TaxID=229007 RepID=A0A4R6ZGB6_9GAMM|nr:hypothetical protein [Halomonas ventosae]TDR51155.1 hypothetical protein DFP85_11971 [Halomonas ventosae]
MKRLLLAASIAALALAMSLPALADRGRHHGYHGASSHHQAHDRYQDRGKHHRKHRHKAHRKHRHHAPRRVVEHHHRYSRPARHRDYRRYRDYRGHTDIPLVSVDGYPLVRIQVGH